MSKVDLYPHNQTAYLNIKQAIENGDTKMAIAHATGTGKSYISARLFEDYNDDQKLILVPTNFLYQNHKGLFDEYGIQNTNVMTYQSLIKKDIEEINNMNYKVVVLDEYHHSTAKKWGESVRDLIKSHPNTIFLGTSATPVRTDGVNTIDEMFDSNCVSELPVSKAIALGILPMPRYVAVDYAYDKRFDELAKKVDKSSCTKEEKEEYHRQIKEMRLHVDQSYGMPIILNKYIENESGKYIVFCRNKKHLEEIKDTVIGWFKQAGFRNVNSYVVHSQNEEKDKEFKEFCNDDSNNLKLLFCINMLSEGLHLKGISGVILLRTTSSYIVFQQQIGRALAANNRGMPLIIDAVNNYNYVQDGEHFFEEIKNEIRQCNIKISDDNSLTEISSFLIIDQIKNIENLLKSIENNLFIQWTDEEDKILAKLYLDYDINECLKQLPNKTKNQCRWRLKTLGIKKDRKWTNEEIALLQSNYKTMKLDECAKLIGRSKTAIEQKAKNLGISKQNHAIWTDDEILYLKENNEKYSDDELGRKLRKTKQQIAAKRHNLKLKLKRKSNSNVLYVYLNEKNDTYTVKFKVDGKTKRFGTYDNIEAAALVSREKAREYGKYWPED